MRSPRLYHSERPERFVMHMQSSLGASEGSCLVLPMILIWQEKGKGHTDKKTTLHQMALKWCLTPTTANAPAVSESVSVSGSLYRPAVQLCAPEGQLEKEQPPLTLESGG